MTALSELLRWLDGQAYDFATPTPLTHARVLARPRPPERADLRDVLGWSRPFRRDAVPPRLFDLLTAAGEVEPCGDAWRSRIRVSKVRGRLFIHSAFPTDTPDAVFLGPDSYRFADFIWRELPRDVRGHIVDVGAGAGVGAITAAGLARGATVTASDVNRRGLTYVAANAAHAAVDLARLEGGDLDAAPDGLSVVLANPPYIADSGDTYSDGGGDGGAETAIRWAEQALVKLAPGGRLLLYSGSAIHEGGRDGLREALAGAARRHAASFEYAEVDPDVFGEELLRPAYARIERIAAVTAVIVKP